MKYEDKITYIKSNFGIFNMLYPGVSFKNVRFRKSDSRYQLWIEWSLGNKVSTIGRFNLEIKLGRVLLKDETCDHIDGDTLNDDISNLQVLTRCDNSSKGPSAFVKVAVSKMNSNRMLGSDEDYCRGENNNFHKLTETEVIEIKKQQLNYTIGSNQDVDLAAKFNVSRKTISAIRLNKTWKHIKF